MTYHSQTNPVEGGEWLNNFIPQLHHAGIKVKS